MILLSLKLKFSLGLDFGCFLGEFMKFDLLMLSLQRNTRYRNLRYVI